MTLPLTREVVELAALDRFLDPTLRDGGQRVHIDYDTSMMCGFATSC